MSFWQRKTRAIRVSRAATKRAKAAGVDISAKSIRRWLSRRDTAERFRECTEKSLASMARSLTYIVPGVDAATRQANALTLMRIVMQEYLRTANTSSAIELSNAWQQQHVTQEGEKNRSAILSTQDEIISRIDDSNRFDSAVLTLNSLRRREAQELRLNWKSVEIAVAALDGNRLHRGEMLAQWASNPPSWLNGAPAEGLLWLANLTADYAEQESIARVFYEMAISAGAFPHDYWVARAAISLGKEVSSAEVQEYIDSHRRGDHPFLSSVEAFIDNRFDDAITLLESWDPQGDSEASISASLKVSSLAGLGKITEAINLAKSVAEETDLAGLATRAAELLLVRATSGRSEHRLMDCQEALSLALQARNRRRSWFGDSVEPLVIAVKAAQLCGDIERSWSLMQLPPQGEALMRETKDERLQSQAALTAALTGRFDEARQILSHVDDAFTVAQVQAVMAEVALEEGDDASELRRLWTDVWNLARNDMERIFAAMGMAEAGADLPDLTELARENADAVEEIKVVWKAMAGDRRNNLAALRVGATKSRLLVVKLAQYHFVKGDFSLAAATLRAGAERWSDAHLMSMAARRFQEANQREEARSAARSAMHLGGPGWAGSAPMFALLVEVESADGDYEAASEAARSLLALDPHDDNARWALVKCLISRVKIDEAWRVLAYHGEPAAPRTKEETLIWLGLCAKYYVGADFAGKALRLIQNWSDDEEVLGRFLQTFHVIGPRSAELPLTDVDREQLQAVAAEFVSKFPESVHWRAVPLGPDDNPLAPLESQLREDHERMKGVRKQVNDGKFPLGTLAMVSGKTYTEAVIRRAAGRVFAVAPDLSETESSDLDRAKDGKVVVDPTAIHSLSLFDSESSELLLGSLPAVIITDQLYKDALQCRDALALASDMQIVWDEGSDRAAVSITAQEDIEILRVRSNRILELLGAMQRVPRLELRVLTELKSGNADWITGLDYAVEHGLAYWSDDRVLRSIARSRGVPTFGTFNLLKQTVENGSISADESCVLQAELLRNYYVDLPYSKELYLAGAIADDWRPLGVAAALTRRHVWGQPEEVAEFVMHASGQVSNRSPEEVATWIGSAAVGLVGATDLPDAASQNLQILLRKVFSQNWFSGHIVSFVLSGIRMGVTDREGVTDPTDKVLRDYYSALVQKMGHAVAASRLMAFMATTSPEDKSLAARIVLTHDD
ncbi:tetratricopeptide repeat protein [Streptomyces scabiei]|uniref:tetratricopeptide repeat protein n=1 Tax=Streptomyces scabiei TaxID=1930 RepID=UPI00131CDF8A|nr:tetratricopeptide repeat protein [Streptomyces scabiei]